MNIIKRPSSKGDKIVFNYDFGRGPGQRPPTGIFIYKNPKDQIQKNHNKQALALLEIKRVRLPLNSKPQVRCLSRSTNTSPISLIILMSI
jgi:hypothetical protein